MPDYAISCCSTADLSLDYFKEKQVPIAYFHFQLDGEDYLDDCQVSMPSEELFRRMDAGAMTKTSQVSVAEYTDLFRPILESGRDILHITLSSGISGSYNSAIIAQQEMQEAFPERKIYILDSLNASSGFGLLLDTMLEKRANGMDIDSLYEWAKENRLHCHAWFFSSDLTYFIRGGRVSKAAGTIGNILGICPLLNIDYEGKLTVREKVRTKKRVIKRIVEVMKEHAEGGADYSGKCFLSHSLCPEDAASVSGLIEQTFPNLDGPVQVYPIGTTIGSHTGPGTIAVFFWGDLRKD